MDLQSITERVQQIVAQDDTLDKSVKFVFPEGVTHIDPTQQPTRVSNDDAEAACTITLGADTVEKLLNGSLKPMNAFFMGKMKVRGDMGVALKIAGIIAR